MKDDKIDIAFSMMATKFTPKSESSVKSVKEKNLHVLHDDNQHI